MIVGCGNIAGGFDAARERDAWPLTHAGAFTRDGRFRIAACVDPDRARLSRFVDHWRVPRAAASLAELADERFDVVSIASPTSLHADHLAATIALEPRLIFCEKPVTPTAAVTRIWTERCADADILLAVNHTRRWAPDVVALAAELRAGRYGRIRTATGWYGKGVLNNGSHMVDLCHSLFGPVTAISAEVGVADFWPDDPTISGRLRAGDVPVVLIGGDARDYARFELEIASEAGIITMLDGGYAWRRRLAGESAVFAGYRTLDAGAVSVGRYEEAMAAAVDNIHGALTRAEPLASDGATALAAQAVCEQLRAISESRR